MKCISYLLATTTLACLVASSSYAQKNKSSRERIDIIERPSENRIDILAGNKPFTSYIWPANVYKPVLWPLFASSGMEVTRGFPLNPKVGERNDHIHQVGIWLNYGNVNGRDFWGTGHTGSQGPEPANGVIRHKSVDKVKGGKGEGVLATSSGWIMPWGKEVLSEKTEIHFISKGNLRIIDRITTLVAADTTVVFKDTKEGMFGIRVARWLELPSKEMVALLDMNGKPSRTKVNAAEGATGNYLSSEGLTGDAVWGTRAKWMVLSGTTGNEKISIAVCDHPENQGYPTYWHARGYGLFAANPLGWFDFTKGKETLNFTLKPGSSVTFRYRVIISSGSHLGKDETDKLADEFAGKY